MPRVNLTIIGTSHISKESQLQVKETILKQKPDCVALELCPIRYYSLFQKKKKLSLEHGITHFILSFMQQHLGKKVGVFPGAEMLSAVRAAQQAGSNIVLIDMKVEKIMEKINQISFWERSSLILKLFFGFLFSPFSKDKFDLSKVPEKKLIKKAMVYMKKELPRFYKILVTDRNEYMAECIKGLSKKYNKIVVVVGAGHKEGLEKLLKKYATPKKSKKPRISKRKKRKVAPKKRKKK